MMETAPFVNCLTQNPEHFTLCFIMDFIQRKTKEIVTKYGENGDQLFPLLVVIVV